MHVTCWPDKDGVIFVASALSIAQGIATGRREASNAGRVPVSLTILSACVERTHHAWESLPLGISILAKLLIP